MQEQQHFPIPHDACDIQVEVCNPFERKTTLSSYTVYNLKGSDREGNFEFEKRYSDFDHIRAFLLANWPGCFVPPLPIKKVIGNTDASFIEQRRLGLETFLKQISKLKHLWYSKQFQTFLRSTGEVDKQLKNLPVENYEEILIRYQQTFVKLQGKGQDTMVLGRVLSFNNYIKKILPAIGSFKEMALSFLQAKNSNFQQLNVLMNYVLPQYEKSCLSVYCNQLTQGKYIFNETNDERLTSLIAKLKEVIANQQFQQIYKNLQLEERQLLAFQEIYKTKDLYEQKLKDFKSKEKDLEIQLIKLNAGKQGVFKSLISNLQSSKAKVNKQIQLIREQIKGYGMLTDYIVLLLGYFEIPRFRKDKLKTYYATLKRVASFQIEFTMLRSQICSHVLENHNLL